jgi:CP family cyanate transporter-like MFS transporter
MPAILAAALSLRIGLVVVGPVTKDVRADTHMSAAVAGLLSAIIFFCMGAFAMAGLPLLRRWGPRRTIALALGILLVGTLVRAAMPTAALVVAATFPVGIGIALVGMALPGVVKRHHPGRPGAITGAYVAALSLGAGAAAALVVPLADALGGWRWAFAVLAAPTALALPLWLRREPRRDAPTPAGPARGRLAAASVLDPPAAPWTIALLLAAIFGLQSVGFSSMISWVATRYRDVAWSGSAAALATAIIPLLTVPAALIIPRLSDGGDRRKWILLSSVTMAAGTLGIALAPTTLPWIWLIAFGLGSGAIFPLVLTLPLDLADSSKAVDRLSSRMLGLGYMLSASGPLLVGALRDATGGFELAFTIVAALSLCSGLLALARPLRARALTVGEVPRRPAGPL